VLAFHACDSSTLSAHFSRPPKNIYVQDNLPRSNYKGVKPAFACWKAQVKIRMVKNIGGYYSSQVLAAWAHDQMVLQYIARQELVAGMPSAELNFNAEVWHQVRHSGPVMLSLERKAKLESLPFAGGYLPAT
jgi:hypothetical protein